MDIAAVPDHYQHLKGLEWLIGEWIDTDDDVDIVITYTWDAHKNFIYQKFSVSTEGTPELEGTQIIGWDPVKKTIRSWIFDSDGTFGEATWTQQNGAWNVETIQTLADGSQASATDSYKFINTDSYSWESDGREINGKILPDIDPVTVVRKKAVKS